MTTAVPARERNPGPAWGFRFLRVADRILPEWIFQPLRAAGTLVAVMRMPTQRKHSRDYLTVILGRPATLREVFRHFLSFGEALMQRLRIANGRQIACEYAPGADAFRQWMETGGPVLLGTMHVGVSDMLGCQLAGQRRDPIYLVRRRVNNSHDTEALAHHFGPALRFLWVNDSGDLIFSLKDALATAFPVAIQCDRFEPGPRAEAFAFLGARRLFPFTIYHLALIFDRPVLLSFGVPGARGRSLLYASPLFRRAENEPRAAALVRARRHFQEFLALLEDQLRQNPFLWFNFTPLNPVAPPARAPTP